MLLNVNTDAAIAFTAKLERISRSALPVVVRQTLNSAAYDVKQNTMPMEANRFVHRKPTFFKANSKVQAAQGFDINAMAATVGFIPKPGDKSHSVEDLEQQEYGGQIDNRAFIALPAARTGKSWNRMVQRSMTMGNITNSITDALNANGKTKQQQYIKSAVHAGKGGFVLGTDRKNGNRFLLHINGVKRVGRDTVISSTKVYIVKAGRQVTPDSKYRGFMRSASLMSAAQMEAKYILLAEKRIQNA